VATVLVSIEFVFLVIGFGILIWDIYVSTTAKSTVTMQIYNFRLDEWESITFGSTITTPTRGITILIIGMLPLVLGMVWRLKGLEFGNSVQYFTCQ